MNYQSFSAPFNSGWGGELTSRKRHYNAFSGKKHQHSAPGTVGNGSNVGRSSKETEALF